MPPAVEAALRGVEAQFAVVLGQAGRVREHCHALQEALEGAADPDERTRSRQRLLPLLRKRAGAIAVALAEHLCATESSTADPRPLVLALLGAREPDLRPLGLERAGAAAAARRLPLDEETASALRALLEPGASPVPTPETFAAIEAISLAAAFPGTPAGDESLATLLTSTHPPALRRLAARLLDRGDRPAPPERWPLLLGAAGATQLAPYLQYTRATDTDLIDLTFDPAAGPALLESLRQAERSLGSDLLGAVIAELGWGRIACGLSCRRWVGLSVEGGLPLVVTPLEAAWFEPLGSARRRWDRFLVIAHGGRAVSAADVDAEEDQAIQRFRRYNVRHAELLGLILEVAPLTGRKVRQILERMDQVVEDFAVLFSAHAEDARRVGPLHVRLRDEVLRSLEGIPEEQPLGPELTRLVQMFEDPRRLDDVRTVHGLKRYLHQQGLRLAFRAFRSGRSTNRTVDLLVAAPHRVLHVLRKIRYLDFEPDAEAGATRIPFAVSLVVEALGRRLLQGKADSPDVELLLYGNEVQAFVRFRNHPVFIRLDLSPPQRGGMIDLEYFGVSQYELDRHPDLSLPWIRRLFQRLDFDVQADDYRLHVRYDKERALDLGDLTRHARRLCALLPHLMEIDWVIGTLPYSTEARGAVADAWAERLLQWGWLPVAEALTADRSRILAAIGSDPSGEREIAWDGRGPYRDRFTAAPTGDPRACLLDALTERGLDRFVRSSTDFGGALSQRSLETDFLEPLRTAAARGELREIAGGRELVATGHDAAEGGAGRLALLLQAGGEPLRSAAALGAIVGGVERHARFLTIGAISGHPVQRATLSLRGEEIELTVLRDAEGIARLATAMAHPLPLGPVPLDTPGGDELHPEELVRRLRRDNYLGAGSDRARETEAESLRERYLTPHPMPLPRRTADEKIVTGIVASPGAAAGFARFGAQGRPIEDVAGAVLLAPAIRPEDTPWIRRCAAVVSTGGGVLSHAGLIALEAHKPALVIAGRWRADAEGRTVLLYRYLDFEETIRQVGPYEVIDRHHLHEREEELREGDLLSVDADAGTLVVLGQDREALALHEGLRHLSDAAEAIQHATAESDPLRLRGRWLRAIHALDRSLARLERPALARHAARELLRTGRMAASVSRKDEIAALFRALFENQACGQAARETCAELRRGLARRLEAARRGAQQALPEATTPAELLELRLGVRRLERGLAVADDALRRLGFDLPAPVADGRTDEIALDRLEALHAEALAALRESVRKAPSCWRARHLLRRCEIIAAALAGSGHEPDPAERREIERRLREHDEARRRELAERPILTSRDGGIELAPLIGAKGANLGEVARILGLDLVPSWFAVTDVVFRRFLRAPAGRAAGAFGLDPDAPLEQAIEAILEREDFDPARQSAAVRRLWQEAPFPEEAAAEILEAYRAMGTEGEGGGSGDAPGPFVAIRSSGLEEDTEGTSGAGQFDTYLYIRGADAVLQHVKLSLASLWTERAIHLRAQQAPSAPRGGGVLVQRIIEARASGVLHTLSAATGALREMVINAGLGLGEGIVSGRVEVDHVVVSREAGSPDEPLRFRYTVGDKNSRVVFDRAAGLGTRREETLYHQRLRAALEYADLEELVRAAARCELVYGYPLDVEFAFEEDRLSILQARPIVTFQSAARETAERFPWPAARHGSRKKGAA